MNFEEYQNESRKTAIYPKKYSIIYPVIGLSGEVGEVANKVKKKLRDRRKTLDLASMIEDELGDVLWYVANLAYDLGLSLDHIARSNIKKLKSRQERGALKGDGDNR